MTDEEILKYYGWEIECHSPYNIRNYDRESSASGEACYHVIDALRNRYIEEQYDKWVEKINRLKVLETIINK